VGKNKLTIENKMFNIKKQMDMKRNIFNIAFLIALPLCFLYFGCSDWTKTEAIRFNDENLHVDTTTVTPGPGPGEEVDSAYYAALREWKQTPNLPQTFLWFDGWSGVLPTGSGSLRGLPDSVTIVANWGGHPKYDLSDDRKADMKVVQELKGTKVVVTQFLSNVGDGVWEGVEKLPNDEPNPRYKSKYADSYFRNAPEAEKEAIVREYAKDLYNMAIEQGYDGLDQDLESYGGNQNLPIQGTLHDILLDELSYWFGPGAVDPAHDRGGREEVARRLLLIMDTPGSGNLSSLPARFTPYIDYIVLQTYSCTQGVGCQWCEGMNTASLLNAIKSCMNGRTSFVPESELVHRIICTESFEACADERGVGVLTMSKLIYTDNGLNTQPGGFGAFRVGLSYNQELGQYRLIEQGIANMYRIYRELNP
jgi:hypothetical protein